MAFLRPITYQALTESTYDIRSNDIHIEQKENYQMAKKLFDEDKKGDILYFYYFNDYAEQNNRFYTYAITREDADYMTKKVER